MSSGLRATIYQQKLRFDVYTAVYHKNCTIYTSYAQQVHITWCLVHVTVYGSGGYVVRAHTASGCYYCTVVHQVRIYQVYCTAVPDTHTAAVTHMYTTTVRRVPLFLNVSRRHERALKSPSLHFCFVTVSYTHLTLPTICSV